MINDADRDEGLVGLREALEPFLATLGHDIGVDEADDDLFRNMSREHARAPRITVGHFRRLALAASRLGGEVDREAIALNCMRWRMDCDGDWPIDAVRNALACISEPHSGDCTKQPWTCMRHEAEAAYKQADQIIALLAPARPQGSG